MDKERRFIYNLNVPDMLSKVWMALSVFATSESRPQSRVQTPRKDAGDLLPPCNPPTKNESYPACKKQDQYEHVSPCDCGKTGAGVAGSRRGRTTEHINDVLPLGASNPGLLRHLHNAARYRMPQCFEGASVTVRQAVGNSNWILGHSWSFSSVTPGGYKCLLSYVNKEKPSLPYFLVEAAPGGQISSELRVSPTNSSRVTVVAQMANAELYSLETIFDAYFNNCTASLIAVNKQYVALHFLQATTKSLSLGAEFVSRSQGNELSSASVAARWNNDVNSFSVTAGNRGVDVCYARVLRPFLTVAAMLEVGFAIRRSVATLAYEWTTEKWTVRASADSDGLVGATLEHALGGQNAQLACSVSALLNHANEKFRLGFGITAAIL